MADLATLAIELEARSAKFDSQLKESRKQIAAIGRQTKTTSGDFGQLARSMKLAAGAFSGAAVLQFVRTQAQASTRLLETSKLLRLNTDLLQALDYSAIQAGQSAETMNTSLQRLIRRADDARRGVPEAVKLFRDLGISMDEVAAAAGSSDALVLRFADAIFQAKENGTDLSLLAKTLDTEGVRVGGSFNKGSEGILAFAREAQRLGQVLDQETIEQLAATDRQLQNFTKATGNFGATLVGKSIDILAQGLQKIGELNNKIGAGIAEALEGSGLPLAEDLAATIRETIKRNEEFAGTLASVTEEGARNAIELRKQIDLTQGYAGQVNELDSALKKLETTQEYARRTANEADQFVRGLQVDEFRKQAAERDRISIQSGRTLSDSIVSGNEIALQSTLSTSSAMADAFTTFATTGKIEMADFARSVSAELLRLIALQGILRGLKGIGLGFLGGIGAAADGAVLNGGRVVPFASGGVVNTPTLFPLAGGRTGLAGEAGPEAIMPLTRGPGGKLGVRASGSGARVFAPTVNVSVSNPQGGDAQGRAFGQGAGVEINRALRGAFQAFVRDESRTGGLLRPVS